MFYPAHFSGRNRESVRLERLTNLGAVPRPTGFYFVAFPQKILGARAGRVRPVVSVPRSQLPNGQTS
jgi:cyclase